jgi:hypothetical protein
VHKTRPRSNSETTLKVIAYVLLGVGVALSVPAPGNASGAQAQLSPAPVAAPKTTAGSTAAPRHQPERFAGRAGKYYTMVWGIDSLGVQWAESGDVIKFIYHVVDAERAQALGNVKYEPSLEDPKAGVKLVVPAMENIGKLRQSVVPENGKSYWMVFSNKGRLVKRGNHVNVVIGPFRANNLVVD